MISESNAVAGTHRPAAQAVPPSDSDIQRSLGKRNRRSLFSALPSPHSLSNVSFQRVPWGDGVGYAIVANGTWLGTLYGDEGRAFIDRLLALPRSEIYQALVQVARKMAADLRVNSTADNVTGDMP